MVGIGGKRGQLQAISYPTEMIQMSEEHSCEPRPIYGGSAPYVIGYQKDNNGLF